MFEATTDMIKEYQVKNFRLKWMSSWRRDSEGYLEPQDKTSLQTSNMASVHHSTNMAIFALPSARAQIHNVSIFDVVDFIIPYKKILKNKKIKKHQYVLE